MDKPKLPAPLKVEGATSRQYVDHLNVMVIYLRELEKWHEWLISATEYRCRELKKENTALEARCRELEATLREVLADRIDAEWSMGTDWTEKVDKLLASTLETKGDAGG